MSAATTSPSESLEQPRVWTHPSGLTIVHHEQRTSPVIAVQVWVGVGAADEVDGQLGMAHVHEHMVFKGSDRRAVGQIAADIEAVGGSINAWTSLEETVYHVVMPAAHGALGVDVLLNGVTRATIDAGELERELEVIREEIRRGDDVPARSHMEKLFAAVWGEHPYARRVIGSEATVSAFDAAALHRFRRQWYDLANVRLVVVGHVSDTELNDWVTAALDGETTRGFTPGTRTGDPPTSEIRPVVEYRDVEIGRLTIAFPGPSLLHDDVPALEVLTTILAGTNHSILYNRLVRGDASAIGAWADGMYLRDAGLIFAGANFAPDAPLREIVHAIGEELSRFTSRLRDEDLRRAIRAFESAHFQSQTTVQGLATSMGNGSLHAGDARWLHRWLERARLVRVEDVRRVAEAWLRPERAAIAVQLPLEAQAQELRASALMDWLEEGFSVPNTRPRSVDPVDADGYQRMVLANGLTLITQVDRTLPIFSAALGVAQGCLHDSLDQAGATTVMSELLVSGNAQWDTGALERELDLLGASFSSGAGEATTVMSVQGVSAEQFATMELAHACWFTSVFPEEELEKTRRVRLRSLRQSMETPGYLAGRALRETFYPGHPYSIPAGGTLASLEALTREDVLAAHGRLLDPSQMVVSVSGDVDVPALIAQLSLWARPAHAQSVAGPEVSPPSEVPAQRVDVRHARKQAIVYVAYPGLCRHDARAATLATMTSILSGQGGRLFGTLREQESLAYSVSMQSAAYGTSGIVFAAMETNPAKVEEAIAGMRRELRRLVDEPLSVEEVARASARISGQMQVGLQRGSARASITLRDELLGIGYRYGLEFPARVAQVDAAAIQALASQLLRDEAEVIIVALPETNA